MNAVIDEDLHRSISKVLNSLGFTVYDIRDYNLRGSTDEQIFKFTQKKNAVLFSADLGFSNIIQFPFGSHKGICILRFPNEISTEKINSQVKKLLEKLTQEDYSGNLIILSPGKIRVRRSKITS